MRYQDKRTTIEDSIKKRTYQFMAVSGSFDPVASIALLLPLTEKPMLVSIATTSSST